MKISCKSVVCALALATLSAAGTKPRAGAEAYKSHQSKDGLAIGAEILPAAQVKNIFVTDLRGYVVVEVGIYPDAAPLEVTHMDFLLRCGSDQNTRAANPTAIARQIQASKGAPPNSGDIGIIGSGAVGYESGPYHRGVYTDVGVGVAAGGPSGPGIPPPPGTSDRDRRIMETELSDMALPAGNTTKPVSGYLYFPYSARKQKKLACELEFASPSGPIRLALK